MRATNSRGLGMSCTSRRIRVGTRSVPATPRRYGPASRRTSRTRIDRVVVDPGDRRRVLWFELVGEPDSAADREPTAGEGAVGPDGPTDEARLEVHDDVLVDVQPD